MTLRPSNLAEHIRSKPAWKVFGAFTVLSALSYGALTTVIFRGGPSNDLTLPIGMIMVFLTCVSEFVLLHAMDRSYERYRTFQPDHPNRGTVFREYQHRVIVASLIIAIPASIGFILHSALTVFCFFGIIVLCWILAAGIGIRAGITRYQKRKAGVMV